jgi:hypothetical protein
LYHASAPRFWTTRACEGGSNGKAVILPPQLKFN